MIHGAHVIVYSKDADADRDFFRDVLGYPFADAGHGWLIFALPPAEVAVHPSESNDVHELYFMCDDVQDLIAEMKEKGVACSPVQEERWGSLTKVTLPGGGAIGVYQPKHASPIERAKARAPKARTAKPKPAKAKPSKPRARAGSKGSKKKPPVRAKAKGAGKRRG
jgi:catechol 2,3-dioxygenase-like lactoylglutathione lyase family enzyme